MKFLDRLCCTLLGLTLSAGGLLLLLDPHSTGGWLHCGTAVGIILALLTLLSGMGTLCGLRRTILSPIVLAIVIISLIFSLLTHHTRIFGLCLILLPMAIYHLVYSLRKGGESAPAWFEWTALGLFALFALAIPVDALVNLPRMEFGPCRVGADARKAPLSMECDTLLCTEIRALLIVDDHIVAKVPIRKMDSPRFQAKVAGDPDRVMADGILAGRLFVGAASAVLVLLMLICAIVKPIIHKPIKPTVL